MTRSLDTDPEFTLTEYERALLFLMRELNRTFENSDPDEPAELLDYLDDVARACLREVEQCPQCRGTHGEHKLDCSERHAPDPWPQTREELDRHADWQYNVANGDTIRGFREWLDSEQGGVITVPPGQGEAVGDALVAHAQAQAAEAQWRCRYMYEGQQCILPATYGPYCGRHHRMTGGSGTGE